MVCPGLGSRARPYFPLEAKLPHLCSWLVNPSVFNDWVESTILLLLSREVRGESWVPFLAPHYDFHGS